MSVYKIYNLTVSGTPSSPQVINYSELTGNDGVSLPSSFSEIPVILIDSINKDTRVYLPALPGTTSFQICKSGISLIGETISCNLTIITSATHYRVDGLVVSGSIGSPDTVEYSTLTDALGGIIPASFDSFPTMYVLVVNKDVDIILTENPGLTSFKIAKSAIGMFQETVSVSIGIFSATIPIFTAVNRYVSSNVSITGTPSAPQEISYTDLVDENNDNLPSATSSPTIIIQSRDKDVPVFLPSPPGLTSFKIARSDVGTLGETLLCSFILLMEASESTSRMMSLNRMMALLNLYIRDIDTEYVTPELKVELLNAAQDRLLRVVRSDLFKNLVTSASSQTVASGVFDLAGLTTEIYNNEHGIITVKVTGGKYCHKVSYEEYRKMTNLERSYSVDKPKYYVDGTTLNFLPSSITSIDLRYMKLPNQMVLGNTESRNVNCELDYRFHKTIVGLACENFIDDSPSAKRAFEAAASSIAELHEKTPLTDSITLNNDLDLIENSDTDSLDSFTINFTPYSV